MSKFKPGQTPWNKDKKGIHLSPDTEFKAGPDHTGSAHPSWKGGIQMPKRDCAHLNVGNKQRVRRPRAVYEAAFGPIPKGKVIVHKDGDNKNDEPWNLIALTRAENLKRNRNK